MSWSTPVHIDAGNEEPAPTADSNPIHRTTLRYTVEYKRKTPTPR